MSTKVICWNLTPPREWFWEVNSHEDFAPMDGINAIENKLQKGALFLSFLLGEYTSFIPSGEHSVQGTILEAETGPHYIPNLLMSPS
jgi:hypothetical protein